jgi:metal-responsive CopG/Arc/MetJ family transcriptional regulator
MPNVRSKDQRGVIVMMDRKFCEEIDAAFPRLGFSDRSTFIRDAVYKRLEEMNIRVPASLKAAPSRAGKGGRPKKADQSVEIKSNHGTVTISQKKKSTSTSAVPEAKPAKPKRGKSKPGK